MTRETIRHGEKEKRNKHLQRTQPPNAPSRGRPTGRPKPSQPVRGTEGRGVRVSKDAFPISFRPLAGCNCWNFHHRRRLATEDGWLTEHRRGRSLCRPQRLALLVNIRSLQSSRDRRRIATLNANFVFVLFSESQSNTNPVLVIQFPCHPQLQLRCNAGPDIHALPALRPRLLQGAPCPRKRKPPPGGNEATPGQHACSLQCPARARCAARCKPKTDSGPLETRADTGVEQIGWRLCPACRPGVLKLAIRCCAGDDVCGGYFNCGISRFSDCHSSTSDI